MLSLKGAVKSAVTNIMQNHVVSLYNTFKKQKMP
jgi:hypothetical protein